MNTAPALFAQWRVRAARYGLCTLVSMTVGCVAPGDSPTTACEPEALAWPTNADCFFGTAAVFVSTERHECGLGSNGRPTTCSWRLSLDNGEWSWDYSDVQEMGTYTCDANRITADREPTLGGEWDPGDQTLRWDDVTYLPVCPTP